MSFFKGLGELAGTLAACVVSAPVKIVAEATGSKFLGEVAEGAFNATVHTGKIVGSLADGTAKFAGGILSQDMSKAEEGLGEVFETSAKTVVGIGKGIARTVDNGVEVISSVASGDMDQAVKTGKQMLKVAAIGAVAIGVCDIVGGIDADGDGIPDFLENDDVVVERGGLTNYYGENPPQYWVNAPHTANGGYMRTMPDASISNNLSAQ